VNKNTLAEDRVVVFGDAKRFPVPHLEYPVATVGMSRAGPRHAEIRTTTQFPSAVKRVASTCSGRRTTANGPEPFDEDAAFPRKISDHPVDPMINRSTSSAGMSTNSRPFLPPHH
jgi:hypothetical protein